MCMYVYIYIYIYFCMHIQRERERDIYVYAADLQTTAHMRGGELGLPAASGAGMKVLIATMLIVMIAFV